MLAGSLGRYRVLEKLGKGGMGEVYRAEDTTLKRQVALKVLLPDLDSSQELLERFQREAETLAALDHPNIVAIHSIEEAQGVRFLVMQLVEGQRLSKLISAGAMPLERIFELAIPLADALSAAHEKGVIHRDLKPGNIMVTPEGRVKILDFGLAKLRREEPEPALSQVSTDPLTEAGRVLGTVPYMSPEQLEGKEIDARSDIFSLGVILYEMATGSYPFPGESRVSVISSIMKDTPPFLTDLKPKLPRHLGRIIKRCLEKSLDRRYQSTRDLRNDLQELRDEIDSGALLATGELVAGAPPARREWTARLGWWFFPLVAIAALMASAAALWLYRWRPEATPPPIRSTPLTSWAGSELEPALAPRGDQVAFTWNGASEDRFDLYVMLLGSGEPLRLTDGPGDAHHPAWSPDNLQIAFLQRLDLMRHQVVVIPALGGAQRSLATVAGAFPGLDWSPDGQWLAVVDQGAESLTTGIVLLSIESGAKRTLTAPPSSGTGDKLPAFSPDGRSLAFVRWYELPRNEVFLIDLEGGTPRMLTSHDGWIRGLDWLSDGSGLVFASVWDGSSGLWELTLEGEVSQLGLGQSAQGLSIAGDGNRLVLSQQFAETNIWRVGGPTATGPAAPAKLIASTRNDWSPEYSPDGRRIAFTSDRSGQVQIWIADSEGEASTLLTTTAAETSIMPRWSPDGELIAFGSDAGGSLDVCVMEVEGGFRRCLTDAESMDGAEDWSRDGRWIYFFSDRTGSYQIWKIPAAGGEAVQLTTGGGLLPKESHDGRFVYYLKRTMPYSIWRVPVDGGEESFIMERPGLTNSGAVVWRDNLVYPIEDPDTGPRIERFDLRSETIHTIAELGRSTRIGKYGRISVSPDGGWILYPRDDSRGNDLVLVENLH